MLLLTGPQPRHDGTVVSGIAGCISIAFWVLVFTPQIWENYRRQSSDGLSTTFIVIWLLGDLFNVVGALLQHVLPTMVVLAAYYTLADLVLLVQCLAYSKRPRRDSGETGEQTALLDTESETSRHTAIKNVAIVICVALFGATGYYAGDSSSSGPSEPLEVSFWGQLLGWVCALLYLASRVPQIKMNYERKSTDGISLMFFVFAVLGNLTYVISILSADMSPRALLINASWLAGSVGTLFLDFVIFAQFLHYSNNE